MKVTTPWLPMRMNPKSQIREPNRLLRQKCHLTRHSRAKPQFILPKAQSPPQITKLETRSMVPLHVRQHKSQLNRHLSVHLKLNLGGRKEKHLPQNPTLTPPLRMTPGTKAMPDPGNRQPCKTSSLSQERISPNGEPTVPTMLPLPTTTQHPSTPVTKYGQFCARPHFPA
jgi:hypothetical protein